MTSEPLFKPVSVVIPAYNSAAILPDVVAQVSAVLRKCCPEFEIIFVNDGSRDQTWSAIAQLAQQFPFVRGINLMRNYGQHNALLCGIRAARYEAIVTMDDDLQHPPEEIPNLLQLLTPENDVVYGTPQVEQHGFWRDAASVVTKLVLQSAMGAEVARQVSAFRAFNTNIRDAFANYQGTFVSIDVLLTWGTTRFTATPVKHNPRRMGQSNYTFRKLLTHALNMMTGFSVLPLQLASWIGFCFTVLGIVILIYVIGRFLVQGQIVPGFAFLASTIALFSGAQLFALGIMGEYLARMHFRIMDKPTYVIRQVSTRES